MSAPVTSAKSLEQWLDDLITAAPDDRRMVAIEGLDAGIGYSRVRCARHQVRLNWLSAFSHLDRTEASHRLQEGTGTRLHQPGDLVAAPLAEQPGGIPWPTSTCGYCGDIVVWATTAAGRAMPVNAEPDPKGNVVLTRHPDGDRRPLAVVLHTEYDRATTAADLIHTSHIQTCDQRPRTNSRRRTTSRRGTR